MSKSKKGRLRQQANKPRSALSANARRPAGITKTTSKLSNKGNKKPHQPHSQSSSQPQASQRGLSMPFHPSQKILLVGEGDFSFSLSLLTHHKCRRLVATTFETRSSLAQKHPQAARHVAALEAGDESTGEGDGDGEDDGNGKGSSGGCVVLYSIDATALCHPTRGGGARLRRLGPFDRVVFQFPHTGGLSRDVNRQVRANQQLCVGFLEAAAGRRSELLAPGGRVVVTLFEGEPYELWGIRNLARHVGLVVDRSAAFEWDLYPGYRHARTLGNLRGETGWKGEDRRARMYVFGRPGEDDRFARQLGKKRKGREDDSEEESDAESPPSPRFEEADLEDADAGNSHEESEVQGDGDGDDDDGEEETFSDPT